MYFLYRCTEGNGNYSCRKKYILLYLSIRMDQCILKQLLVIFLSIFQAFPRLLASKSTCCFFENVFVLAILTWVDATKQEQDPEDPHPTGAQGQHHCNETKSSNGYEPCIKQIINIHIYGLEQTWQLIAAQSRTAFFARKSPKPIENMCVYFDNKWFWRNYSFEGSWKEVILLTESSQKIIFLKYSRAGHLALKKIIFS